MKTLITVAKIVAIRVWTAIAKTIGLAIGLIFLLIFGLGIHLCLLAMLQFGIKLWLDHSHVTYWLTAGVMWVALGFAIRLFCISIKYILYDIQNGKIAKRLRIQL